MKIVNRARLATTLMVGALLGLGSMAANAATASNTQISNTATVGYSVGGSVQTPIASSPTGNSTPGTVGTPTVFVVDAKLVLTVTRVDATIVNVSPGQSVAILKYQVTNNGNAAQGVLLTAGELANGIANPFGGSIVDNFAPTTPVVRVSNNNSTTYVSANDTASSIPQLAAGASQYVFVISSIPTAQANGDLAALSLTAQVADAGATSTYGSSPGSASVNQAGTPWTAGIRTALNIFADAAGSDDAVLDGKSSARDAYLVQSAKLTISKTSSVITDPVYCTTAGVAASCTIPAGMALHSIPGAAVQYTITVTSCDTTTCPGAVAATAVSLTDSLATQISAGNLAYVAGSMKVADPSNSNVATTCTDVADADKCSFVSNQVSVSSISLNPGQNAAVTFLVTIP